MANFKDEIKKKIDEMIGSADLWDKKYPSKMIPKYLGFLPELVYNIIDWIERMINELNSWKTAFVKSNEETMSGIATKFKSIDEQKLDDRLKETEKQLADIQKRLKDKLI
jgi:hypothetical protein